MEARDSAPRPAGGRRYSRTVSATPTKTRVLVVEDDPRTASGIVRGLAAAGFEVELATDGVTGCRLALRRDHDVVVLDLLLPDRDGFEVLARIRDRVTAPTIVLTACADLGDRLRSFELGAADFLAKPFFVEELVARIRSRLAVRGTSPSRIVRWADAAVDLDARTLSVAGLAVALTRDELDLLAYLVARPGRAVPRRVLAEEACDRDSERDPRTVDTHVARLRRKLGPRAGAAIVTVWGIGYRFEGTGGT